MKHTKKLIALITTLVLLLTTATLTSQAKTPQYKKHVSFGDSVAVGFGPYNYTNRGFSRVDFAFPALVSDSLNAELVPLSRTGFRTQELRAMLDDTYKGDDYLFKLGKDITPELISKYKPIFKQQAQQADLITIQIGMNDAFALAKRKFEENPNNTPLAVAEAIDAMWYGYTNFRENWDAITGKLLQLNPNAKIIVVGMYNPIKEIKLTDVNLIKLGQAADAITLAYNTYMQSQSKHADDYTYVDISDVELFTQPAILTSGLDTTTIDVHPTKNGHKYIAQQILKALN